MLQKSEKLRKAHELKEAFLKYTREIKDKKLALKTWIRLVMAYDVKAFNKLTEMMYRWFNPIRKGLETGFNQTLGK